MLGRLVRRFGERALLTWSLLACAIGYVVLGFAYTIPLLLLSSTIAAFGGVARPVVTSLVTQVADRREQGTVLGLTQSLIAGLMIQSQMLAGWALAAAGIACVGWMVRLPEGVGARH
jgi:MFS family permease